MDMRMPSEDHYGFATDLIHTPESPILDLPARLIHGTRNMIFGKLVNVDPLTYIARHTI
jgi:hypothetical protein